MVVMIGPGGVCSQRVIGSADGPGESWDERRRRGADVVGGLGLGVEMPEGGGARASDAVRELVES